MNIKRFIFASFVMMLTFSSGITLVRFYSSSHQTDALQEVQKQQLIEQPDEKVDALVAQTTTVEQRRERFTVAGVKTDEEVERFWTTFQKAVAENDRNKVTSMAAYPLRVDYYFDPLKKNYRLVKNRAAFIKTYDKIFDDALKNLIANTSVDDIWARSDGITTPRGEIWIGVFCLDRKCDGDYEVRLRTIHANSIFIDRPNQPK